MRETSTERAARKAERKSQKAADAALLLPQDARQAAAEVSFYSSTDNPFHDANLGDKFVWGKKREKERKSGMTMDQAKRRDMERSIESQVRPLVRLVYWKVVLIGSVGHSKKSSDLMLVERNEKWIFNFGKRNQCAQLVWPNQLKCQLGSTERTISTSSKRRRELKSE